jgi:hypothetical protein
MRARFVLPVILALIAPASFAQTIPDLPPGAEPLEQQLLPKVGPVTRARIKDAVADRIMDGSGVALAIPRVMDNVTLPTADYDIVEFLIMIEAMREAQEDLRAVMAGVKVVNDAKAAMPPESAAARGRPGRPGSVVGSSPEAVGPFPRDPGELDAKLAEAKNIPRAMDALVDAESRRLQLTNDRLRRTRMALMAAQRNLPATASLTQNLK